MRVLCVLLLCFLSQVLGEVPSCKGCVSLDEHSFKKVSAKFKTLLVKFDVAYPYGDKHEAFVRFAVDQADTGDLLVGEVGVKDYGEKDNAAFAQSLGIDVKNLPVIILFNGDNRVTFEGDYTVEELRRFVTQNSNVYLALPGCLQAFDELSGRYVTSDKAGRKKLLDEARRLADGAKEDESSSAKVYLKYMEKIAEEGAAFLKSETSRLEKVIKGKVSEKKREDLVKRSNILYSFKRDLHKDEL